MIKNGIIINEDSNDIVTVEKKKKHSKTLYDQSLEPTEDHHHQQPIEQLDLLTERKDSDCESGISSIRRSNIKVAKFASGTTITTDEGLEDDGQVSPRTYSLTTGSDEHRDSDCSSITNFTINKTSSDFNLNSKTSRRASEITTSPAMSLESTRNLSKIPTTRSGMSINPTTDTKERSGVRRFIHKLFKGSPSTSSSPNISKSSSKTLTTASSIELPKSPQLNIDLVHRTAYPPMSPLPVTQGPIRLLVLRHGERLDRYYSSQWLRQAFDKDGNYCRFSPILPETLPFRASIRDFDLDPPLTYKGLKDSYHTGTVLKDKNIHINYCYSSPALRCVQTASKILEGLQLQNKMKIRIEPGLFECTGWYTASETSNVLTMPRFMTRKELVENKYPVDKHYHEQITMAEISQLETELEFYQRSHAVTTSILKMHESEYISQLQQGHATLQTQVHILFIAHAPNLETCTRKLCGGKFRPDTLPHVIRNVDFLTMTVIEKTDNNSDKWIFRRSSFYGDEF